MDFEINKQYEVFPEGARLSLLQIRALIYSLAQEQDLGDVSETLKWGEPSYQVSGGSPVRLGWKESAGDKVSVYFHCQTSLVETFREIYRDTFTFIGNRELRVCCKQPLPIAALQQCLSMALRYHKIKHLPLLGA